jgi:hypothetical protein
MLFLTKKVVLNSSVMTFVIPVKTGNGIHCKEKGVALFAQWIPAFAGMTFLFLSCRRRTASIVINTNSDFFGGVARFKCVKMA